MPGKPCVDVRVYALRQQQLAARQRRVGGVKWVFAAGGAALAIMWLIFAWRSLSWSRGLAAGPVHQPVVSTDALPAHRDGAGLPLANPAGNGRGGGRECSEGSMFQWAKEQGAVGNVDLHHFEDGRGLRVRQDFAVGDTVLSVPWEMLITVEHLINSSHPVGALAEQLGRRIPQTDYLALFLLYESQNPLSHWQPWLCMLPKAYSVPIFWSEAEMRSAKASQLLREQTHALKQKLHKKFHDLILPLVAQGYARPAPVQRVGGGAEEIAGAPLFSDGVLVYERYVTAIAAVRSRCFAIPWNGRKLKTLVPVVDMINHQQHTRSAMVFDRIPFGHARRAGSGYVFELVAGQNYTRGQEVHIAYAKSCNERLLLVYGFDLGAANDKRDCHPVLQSVIDDLDDEE